MILLYLIFAYRGFRISMLAQDGFSKLLAAGLTAAVAIQAFIIIGGVVGLIPLTGITLPSSPTGLEHRRQLRDPRAPAHGFRAGQSGARE